MWQAATHCGAASLLIRRGIFPFRDVREKRIGGHSPPLAGIGTNTDIAR
jgi:hypothetical protein